MKIQITYEELKAFSINIVDQLNARYSKQIKEGKLFLFAVARGGLTFGQLVSYRMALPLGVVYPRDSPNPVRLIHPACDDLRFEDDAVFIYLEDVVAKGRTLQKVLGAHRAFYGDKIKAQFIPVVLDPSAPSAIVEQVNMMGTSTTDWVVFPHEEFDAVTEGDRGLFRAGTSNNSKPI